MTETSFTENLEFNIVTDTSSAKESIHSLTKQLKILENKILSTGASLSSIGRGVNFEGKFKAADNQAKELRSTLKTLKDLTGDFDKKVVGTANKFNTELHTAITKLGNLQSTTSVLENSFKAQVVSAKNLSVLTSKQVNFSENLANISNKRLRALVSSRDEILLEIKHMESLTNIAGTQSKIKEAMLRVSKLDRDIQDQQANIESTRIKNQEKSFNINKQNYIKEVESLAIKAKSDIYYKAENSNLSTILGKKRIAVKEELAYLRVLKDSNIEGVLNSQIAQQELSVRSKLKDLDLSRYKEQLRLNSTGTVTQTQLDNQLRAKAAIAASSIEEVNLNQRIASLSNNALYTLQQKGKVYKEQLQYFESINKNGALDLKIQDTKTKIAQNTSAQLKEQANAQVSLNTQREVALKQLKREEEYNSVLTMHAAKRAIGYSVLFAGVAAATAVVGSSVKNFLEADLQMRTLAAVLKINTERASTLSTSIRALGETFGGSLSEIEDVAIALARAGIASKDMLPATELVLKMARLTGDTFAESAKAIISFQQVFGDTTTIDVLGNKLAYIANVSRLSTQDIGTFSNYALAAAKSVGMTEDVVGGLAAAFSNAGVNASTIGTEIRTFTGILNSSSKDVQDFFLGMGISQKAFAFEVAKGGEASNKAILGFVDKLSRLDKTQFNNLTGNMDKLTTNVLSLMRNNKVNIEKFTLDLQAGAEGQLKQVDVIIEAHQVKLEKMWNWTLNKSQEFLSTMEKGLTTGNLLREIADITSKLEGKSSVGTRTVNADEKKALEERLKVLTAIQEISIEEKDLTILQGKIAKATGAEWAALKDQEFVKLQKINDLKTTIEGTVKARSKEEIAELKKTQEEYLKAKEIELSTLKEGDEGYAAKKARVKELTDEVKKLTKAQEVNLGLQVGGLDYKSLGTSIKSKYTTGSTINDSETAAYWEALASAYMQTSKAKEALYSNTIREGFEAEVTAIKGIYETTEDYTLLLDTVKAKIEDNKKQNDIIAAGNADNATAEQAAAVKTAEEHIKANNAFLAMFDTLRSLGQERSVLLSEAEEMAALQAKSAQKILEYETDISIEKAKQDAINSGKSQSGVIAAELKVLKEKLQAQKDLAKTPKDSEEVAARELEIAKKTTEYSTALRSEKEKSSKADERAEKAQERATKKAMEALDLEAKIAEAKAQLEEGSITQYELAEKIRQVGYAEAKDQEALGKSREAALTTLKADLAYRERINTEISRQAGLQVAAWESSQIDAGVMPTEMGKLLKQIEAQEWAINEARAKGTSELKLQDDLLDLQNQRKRIELERTKEIAEVYRQMNLDNLQAQAQLMSNAVSYNANLTGTAASAQKLAQTMVSTSEKETQYIVDKSNLDKKYADERQKYTDNSESSQKALAALEKAQAQDLANLNRQNQQTQILGYADIAGAMSGMFEQGSKDAQNFQRIQAALAMVAGIQAILTQGQGDPYSAPARMLAMAGMVISVLANAKIAFGGIGGNKTTTSSDKLSAIKANEGTGTLLGAATEQSESIQKSLAILEDYAKPEYQTLLSMNKHLSNIASGIGGVGALLIQNESYAMGYGYKSTDSGWKNKVSADTSTAKALGLAGSGIQDIVATSAGGLATSLPIALGTLMVDKYLLGGTLGNITNKLLGGIFGKTSVSSKLKDSGMYFADQLLTEAVKNFVGSAYQTIETTTTTKSWFKKSTNTSSKTSMSSLSEQTNNQFTMVINSLYKTTLLAGEALDTATSTIEERLKNFVVSIGKVSLKKKSGAEIQETLEAVFSKLGDQIAGSAFPLLKSFQHIGEGLFTTMTRVATGMETAEYYIERLGYQFQDLSYWEIINKQGDIGFEALLQSIVKTDEAAYGLSNNLVQIITSLNSTAEELYGAYVVLDNLRGKLQFLQQDLDGLSFAMIRGAGGIEQLNTGFTAYFENFLTEGEQLAYATESMTKEFNKLNVVLPTSKDAYKELLKNIDLNTEAGQELYGRLLLLAEGFGAVSDEITDAIATLEEQLSTKGTDAFSDFSTTLEDMFSTLSNMVTQTKTLIDQITDDTDSEDLYTKLVRYNKLFDEFAISNSEDTYESILTLSKTLADNQDVAPAVLRRLNESLASLTDKEEVVRVNIVDGLGELLKLNSTQVTQLKYAVKDGKVTNQELNSISGLTTEQRDGIIEFATNSSAFSTENTLSNVELYAQQQLQLYKDNIEKEKQSLSSTTFQYGDYVGLQEQIDIAKTLGVSYDTAKPMVEQLQALSTSTDIKKDLSSLLGYKGYEYDITKASQVEQLSQYLSPDIMEALSTIKTESVANIDTRTKQAAFEAAKSAFLLNLQNLYNELQSRINNINSLQEAYDYWKRKDEGDGEGKKYKPAKDAARASINENNAAISWIQSIIPQLEQERIVKGYYSGGYTGNGGVYDIAGIVHKGEYVLSQNDLRNVGGRSSVEAFIGGKSSQVVLSLDPVVAEIKALRQENENMKQLLVKIAADGTKALNTQRGILDAVSLEEI